MQEEKNLEAAQKNLQELQERVVPLHGSEPASEGQIEETVANYAGASPIANDTTGAGAVLAEEQLNPGEGRSQEEQTAVDAGLAQASQKEQLAVLAEAYVEHYEMGSLFQEDSNFLQPEAVEEMNRASQIYHGVIDDYGFREEQFDEAVAEVREDLQLQRAEEIAPIAIRVLNHFEQDSVQGKIYDLEYDRELKQLTVRAAGEEEAIALIQLTEDGPRAIKSEVSVFDERNFKEEIQVQLSEAIRDQKIDPQRIKQHGLSLG